GQARERSVSTEYENAMHIQVAHIAMLEVPIITAHQGIHKQRGIVFGRAFYPFHLPSIEDR
ncbi:MAG: hypothetical protein AAB312_02330, partial [Pseudomonadota bacterium]